MLLLDSSTSACSVALSVGNKIVGELCQESAQGQHSSLLAPMVEQLLEKSSKKSLSLDAVVVSAGPGSYTGLRIASSFAKGLCSGLGVPLIAIPTLALMASGYLADTEMTPNEELRIVPMIDARRMEVYTAVFDGCGARLSCDNALVLSGDSCPFEHIEERRYHFIGDGSGKVNGLWTGHYITVPGFIPEARHMLPLALSAYSNGDFVDLAYWTPHYLKEYVAIVGQNKVLKQAQ